MALFSSQQCTDYYKKSLDSFDTFPERKAAVEGVNDISFFGWLIIALDRLLFSTEMFNINNYSPVINKVCTAATLSLCYRP